MNTALTSDTVSWNLQLSVRDGQHDNLASLMKEMVAATQEEEPGTLVYEWFPSADGSTCHIYERYRDSESVLVHLGNFGTKYAERFLACLEPTAFAVYGNPRPKAREVLDGFGAQYLGFSDGFFR